MKIVLPKILSHFNALLSRNSREQCNDGEEPFLKSADEDAFSTAGIWSKLGFLWLNPLFKKGHLERLEFQHVPTISQSEAAAEAFSSLEESLGKQNPNKTSLWKAILHTLWRPLALNAIFAGITTIAKIFIQPYHEIEL